LFRRVLAHLYLRQCDTALQLLDQQGARNARRRAEGRSASFHDRPKRLTDVAGSSSAVDTMVTCMSKVFVARDPTEPMPL
jgi:hypothetical protein